MLREAEKEASTQTVSIRDSSTQVDAKLHDQDFLHSSQASLAAIKYGKVKPEIDPDQQCESHFFQQPSWGHSVAVQTDDTKIDEAAFSLDSGFGNDIIVNDFILENEAMEDAEDQAKIKVEQKEEIVTEWEDNECPFEDEIISIPEGFFEELESTEDQKGDSKLLRPDHH